MKTKSLELLQALNTAAAILQQVSLSEADVFYACRDEIARLGFRGGLSVLDETGQKLIIKTIVQPEWMVKILDDLEVRTGYKAKGYSFPYKQVSVYMEVIEANKAVFVSDSSVIISQMLPEGIRSLAGFIIKAMGSPPGIYAPLKRHNQTFGILNILGQELTPEDIPAVEAFANHISIALENAHLFEALRETEKNAKEFQEKMRTLHEVNFELAGIESLDELYHAVVEAGLKKLGFERFALFLIEDDGKYLAGTYGTDEKGAIRAEHHVREEINDTRNKFILDWLLSRTRSTHLKNVTLHGAGQDLDRGGSNVFAIVWDGSQAIGMLAIDNYLTQRPPRPFVEELLSMYGNVIGHLITRLRNEQALRESEQRYRALFEESPISIWEEDFSLVKQRIETLREQGVKDFQSYFDSHPEEVAECAALVKVVDVNKAALKIYHADKKADLLKSLREILESSRSLTVFRGELAGIANGETVMYRENTDTTLTGELIDVSLSWQVAPGYENNLARVIVSIIDITARKRAERDRERLITDLEAKNTELERFTYTVSHDLKSPLVTINGFLGYLEQDAASGNLERLKKDTHRIQEAVNKMQQLLNELLELSRIGRMMNAPQINSFEALVREAMEVVQGRLNERNIQIQIQPNLPAVFGDKPRLVEVMQNLLDNAAKYMGDQPEPRIEIGQRGMEQGKPIFYVKDNGMGVAPEYHERIFGLFNKLDARSEGTGVGLALVQRIVEVHQGRIWIESKLGQGSTLLFTLPPSPSASVQAET